MIRHVFAIVALCALALLSSCNDDPPPNPATDSGRPTVTLAVLDDPARRSALFAIDNDIVSAGSVDVIISYLPQSALDEALASKQYDIVEGTTLALPIALDRKLDLIVLSAGRSDNSGTLLFVRASDRTSGPAGLSGAQLGVASVDAPATLRTRYLLQEGYEVNAERQGGDVTFVEAPAQSLSSLLRSQDVDAAAMQDLSAFLATNDAGFRVLANVSEEVAQLPSPPLLDTVLATYRDFAQQKGGALGEVNRLLDQSLAYFKANRDRVIDEVAAAQGSDSAYLEWWWEHAALLFGSFSSDAQQQLLETWEAAKTIGEIESYPSDLSPLIFAP